MIKDNAYDGIQGRVFAAALSLSGDEVGQSYSKVPGAYSGIPTQAVVDELRGVPIWAVNTPKDNPTWDRAMATALPNSAYRYSEIQTSTEDTWDFTYPLPEGAQYFDWLFSQSANLIAHGGGTGGAGSGGGGSSSGAGSSGRAREGVLAACRRDRPTAGQ